MRLFSCYVSTHVVPILLLGLFYTKHLFLTLVRVPFQFVVKDDIKIKLLLVFVFGANSVLSRDHMPAIVLQCLRIMMHCRIVSHH